MGLGEDLIARLEAIERNAGITPRGDSSALANLLNNLAPLSGFLGFEGAGSLRIARLEVESLLAQLIQIFSGNVEAMRLESSGNLSMGSNLAHPESTSFKFFSTAAVYNFENFVAGDILIGDNTTFYFPGGGATGAVNMKWDATTGQLQFRRGRLAITAFASSYGFSTLGQARAFRSTKQTISNNTFTSVIFDTEIYDDAAFINLGAHSKRITIPDGYDGVYLFGASVAWDVSAVGNREVIVTKNSEDSGPNVPTLTWDVRPGFANAYCVQTIVGVDSLVAGDYLTLLVWKDGGGSLDLVPTGLTGYENQGQHTPKLWLQRLRGLS